MSDDTEEELDRYVITLEFEVALWPGFAPDSVAQRLLEYAADTSYGTHGRLAGIRRA